MDLLDPIGEKELVLFISFRVRLKVACSMKEEIYLRLIRVED